MNIRRVRLSKMSFGVIAAVVLAAAVVAAVVINSAQEVRTQDVFGALRLEIAPDPFPTIIAGLNSDTNQTVWVNVTNGPGNPDLNVTLSVSLNAPSGCAEGSVSINGTNLCLGDWVSASIFIVGASLGNFVLVLEYSPTFSGTATYTFQATGTS